MDQIKREGLSNGHAELVITLELMTIIEIRVIYEDEAEKDECAGNYFHW